MKDVRLTTGQRLAALERENSVVREKLKILHEMFKEQRLLINEFITRRITLAGAEERTPSGRPEEAVYTFVCQQRFDRIEAAVDDMRASTRRSGISRKAV